MDDRTMMSGQCNIILNNGYMCGIQAVGRCDACQRAYCTSHQAYRDNSFGGFVPVHNLCVTCEKERLKAVEEREREAAKPVRFFHDGRALAVMRRSGVQKVHVYQSDYMTKRYSFFGEGWVIGEYNWSHTKGPLTYYEHAYRMRELPYSSTYVTVLLDKERQKLDKELQYYHGLIPVVSYADGYEHVREYGYRMSIVVWDKAAEAVKKLAGVSDDV